jgi:histone H3/H4
MKNEGATPVGETAVELLIDKLTAIGTDLTKIAIKDVKTDKRKRLTAANIVLNLDLKLLFFILFDNS